MLTEAYQTTIFEAEQYMLAYILLSKQKPGNYLHRLQPEHFSDERHRIIYSNILQMMLATTPVNEITLKAHLIRNKQFGLAGAEEYLDSLAMIKADENTLEEYYRIILYASRKRQMGTLATELLEESNDESVNPDDSWNHALKQMHTINRQEFRDQIRDLNSLSLELVKDLDAKMNPEVEPNWVKTGFVELDAITGGFQPGELVVVAGRPAMGKSGFLSSMILKTCCTDKIPMAIFTLEISGEQLTQRLLSIHAGIPSESIRKGHVQDYHYQIICSKLDEIKGAPLYVVDRPEMNIHQIRLTALQLKSQYDIKVLMIDYLQLIPGYNRKTWNRENEIAEVCRSLKLLARELQIAVIVTSQLSRAVETRGGDKKPILSDLRESGAIEQDADKVLFLYRGEYYGLETDCDGNPTKGIAEVIVAKNRMGPCATARLRFIRNTGSFDNLDDAEQYLEISEENAKRKFSKLFYSADENEEIPPF